MLANFHRYNRQLIRCVREKMMEPLSFLLMLCFCFSFVLRAEETKPRDILIPPLVQGPIMAINGGWLAARLRDEGDLRPADADLAVWRVGKPLATALRLPYEGREISWYSWVGGARLVFALKYKGLVLYDAATDTLTPLLQKGPRPAAGKVSLLSSIPGDPSQLLVSWADTGFGYPAVYRVNLGDGRALKLINAYPPIRRWWASLDGTIAFGEGFEGQEKIIYSRDEAGDWFALQRRDMVDDPSLTILSISAGGTAAYVALGSAQQNEGLTLRRLGLGDNSLSDPLIKPTLTDVQGVVLEPSSGFLLGAIQGPMGHLTVPLNPALQRFQSTIKAADIRSYCYPTSGDLKGEMLVMTCLAPGRTAEFYIINIRNSTAELIGEPGIAPAYSISHQWTDTKPQIPYIVMEGANTQKGSVLWVHGGPHDHDKGLFSPDFAALTKAGYRVIVPNFRGSTGYGDAHERAGWGGWGTTMQLDLYRLTVELKSRPTAPDAPFFIAGISYGGFSSLLGAAERSDLFDCALSINGVTNLPAFFTGLRASNPYFRSRFLGDYSHDSLWQRSPLARLHIRQAPVMLIHSSADRSVPLAHMQDYKKLTDERFIPALYHIVNGGDHGLTNPDNRREVWKQMLNYFETCPRS